MILLKQSATKNFPRQSRTWHHLGLSRVPFFFGGAGVLLDVLETKNLQKRLPSMTRAKLG